MTKKTVFIITDGIGYNESCNFNAFCNAKKPTYEYLFENVPNSLIKTYGEFVGLPDGQMGNSEVGHMTLGAGRILYQDLVKINIAIKEDRLKDNEIYSKSLKNCNVVHLIGLLSDGGVHSHINHTIALAKIAQDNGKKVYLHLITDGRDVSPTSAKEYTKLIKEICNDSISIATVGGRYYGMDRDNNWDRVEKAYEQIVNASNTYSSDIDTYIDEQYAKNIFDEFIEPISFDGYNGIKCGDLVVFTNFRSDRARELSSALAKKDFDGFSTNLLDIDVITMTQYDKNLPLPIMFPKTNPSNTISEVVSRAGLRQLHTAETEKYAHVTFFFNGGVETPFENEERALIPSPKVATYDMQPEMSAPAVGQEVRNGMDSGYDMIVVNFANGDMVGHTGVYDAGIKAVEAVDYELGLIIEKAKELGYNILLTSDHGNCEMMRDDNGNTLTNHTVGDVFCFVIADGVTTISDGGLNNIAPTVLKLMNLEIPKEMDQALF